MIKKFKLVLLLPLALFALSACLDDGESADSSSPEIKNPDTGIDVGEQGYPSAAPKFSFRADPKINTINLSWNSVNGATSYDVSRTLEGGSATVENTESPNFSFSTGESETYQVWVAALDENGSVIEVSNKMNVTTGSSAALMLSDEGP